MNIQWFMDMDSAAHTQRNRMVMDKVQLFISNFEVPMFLNFSCFFLLFG